MYIFPIKNGGIFQSAMLGLPEGKFFQISLKPWILPPRNPSNKMKCHPGGDWHILASSGPGGVESNLGPVFLL